jgi:glycosyltransferase involved in cell wall biosynthesis
LFKSPFPKAILSELEMKALHAHYKVNNIHVLANCIDLNDSRAFQRKFRDDNMLKALFIGRLHPSKGLDVIIDAFKILKEKELGISLNIAGSGPDITHYLKKLEESLGNAFIYYGIVSGEEKLKLLKKCDIFLPSLYGEGMPIALIEGMSYGLIPITTNDGSMNCLVKNRINGYIVRKGSSMEIVTAIEELIKNKPLLQELSKKARYTIINQFNEQSYFEKLNNLYNKTDNVYR